MSCNHLHKIGGICCQKIIPLVFEQSYSYYEQLCAFLHKLNELVDAVNLQNTTIAEFENEVNEAFNLFKSEMRIAFADFQIEMRQDFEDFTTQIETEWNTYKTELNAEWQNEKQINAAFRSDLQSAWTTYRTELNASFEIFKSQETAARQTFETNITNQQNTFQNTITQQQASFENEIEQLVTDNADIVYMPFNGVQTFDQTDLNTIDTIGNVPLDTNQIVQVYYKGANDSDYRFIKRRAYTADIETDTDIPSWAHYNDKFILVFENPIINEYIKSGCIPYATIGFDFGTQNRRLAIYKMPQITNRHIDFASAVLQGTYIQTGEVEFPQAMTIVEQPMTGTPLDYYTMFVIEQGCSKFIPQITQPTGATTRIYRGYLYSTFCGGLVRDPLVNMLIPNIMTLNDDINNYVISTPLQDNSGVIRWLCPSSTVRNSLVNLPSDFPAYPDFEIEFRQFKSGGIGIQTITGGSLSSIYVAKRIYKNNSFSSWYKETLTPLT